MILQKVPTVFVRDHDHGKYVTETPHPDCLWVLEGEGIATRKYDGTCVMFDGSRWWARREVKGGKATPSGFVPATDPDPITSKVQGWEPIDSSSFVKFFNEAIENAAWDAKDWSTGTYELVGPKINGNPERLIEHQLVFHDAAEILSEFTVTHTGGKKTRDFDSIRRTISVYAAGGYEGIVYHHPDGRMAKIKARDFRKETPA